MESIVNYMFLGGWVLTLIIVSLIVSAHGNCKTDEGTAIFQFMLKILFILIVAGTFYSMGEHFSNI